MDNNEQTNISKTLLGANDKGKVTYEVNGEEVNLSFQIVRNFLVRGNDPVTDAEVVQFIFLCKANLVNPFVGDAYLVKYRNNNGRPATAQMIIAKEAFVKRAEASPKYGGYQAGIIVFRGGEVVELEGAFYADGDKLIGGWARVDNGRKYPVVQKVRLAEYNKDQSTWKSMPATMIRKVALAQALREAFPLQCGGMYIPEEAQAPDEQSGVAPAAIENSESPAFAPAQVIDRESPAFTPDPEPAQQADPEPVAVGVDPEPEDAAAEGLFKLQ